MQISARFQMGGLSLLIKKFSLQNKSYNITFQIQGGGVFVGVGGGVKATQFGTFPKN